MFGLVTGRGAFMKETGGFSLSKIQMFPHKSTLASDQTKHALHDPTVPNENLGVFFPLQTCLFP